ncbi:hypothetical protein C2857_000169 [Epichloe festucae Fl1]|uniref:glucan endo-1,3-beta-D-glucosidase n=1 Tax=Epichloe festucae (strain Fl1) TaxID=877507 RepID=A0A7S9KJN3_EPIFF|nr:hypothetical protein C2857_000169 [Epichloe festucae Fl1]
MQRYPRGDPYEREPLDAPPEYNGMPLQRGAGNGYEHSYSNPVPPYYDNTSSNHPQDPYASGRMHQQQQQQQQQQQYQPYQPYVGHDSSSSGSYGNMAPGADNFSEHAAGAMAGSAYNAADGGTGRLPPPPSRAQYPSTSTSGYQSSQPGGYAPETVYNRGPGQHQMPEQGSRSSLNPFGTPSATHSPARSLRSFGTDSFADDPYQGLSSSQRYHDASLGVVNPHEIADDGDDGLHYGRPSQRNSMLSLPQSDRTRPGIGPAAAGAAAAAAVGGVAGRSGYQSGSAREKSGNRMPSKSGGRSKKRKWAVIILIFLIVAGAIVGGVVGSMIAGNKKSGGGGDGQSAADDAKKNGDLDINSSEIKALMNNKDLHKVFPGMDYTPLNTQYPDCLHNPPSQNNITRDVAVLSQLTNKIRLYGTDCNQTQMVVHAIEKLRLKESVKVWLGVWQDKNATTNARQLSQMWDILDQYGADPFEGVIVANEILFRKEMTVTQLGTVLDGVRSNFTSKGIKLPVASSDLGDDWTADLAAKSDYVMANIHPFFAGKSADIAASWTYSFWTGKDKQFWKADNAKNIISETGWPSAGGKNCGESPVCTSSTSGSVASIDGMNTFMKNWVCEALANGTNYFWFEAFDEPWKIRFNEKDKEWEDKWGLMDVNRQLKPGVKIPDCGGKTV